MYKTQQLKKNKPLWDLEKLRDLAEKVYQDELERERLESQRNTISLCNKETSI